MATSGRYLYAIRIEGIGDNTASAANRCYRWTWARTFFDVAGTSDPDDLYKPALLRWPKELEFSVDFRTGDPTMGSLTFELRRTADVLTHFWAGVPARLAKLNGALTAAASSVVLDTAGVSGTVYLGREAILLGSESPSKTYAITRAQLLTSAQQHDDGVQVYGSMHPTTLAGRLVELLRVSLDSSGYSTEMVRWSGVARRCYGSGADQTILEVDSVLALIKSTDIYQNPWALTVGQSLDEGADRLPASGYGAHPRTDTSTSRALVMVDDSSALVLGYKTDGDGEAVVFRNLGELVGLPLVPTMRGVSFREIFSSAPAQPSNNASPTTLTLPLQGDPGKLILQLLLTTANDGVSGSNDSTYDTGINQLAGNIPASLIDKTSFERWGAEQETLTSFYIGHDGDDALNLFDLIQEILAPRGASLMQAQGGKLEIATLNDAAVFGTSNTITQSQVVSVGDGIVQDRKLEEVLERVTFKYNDRPVIGGDIINATDVVNERLLHRGTSTRLDMFVRGLTSRPVVTILLQSFVARFHAPIIEYSLECLSTADYWPGEVVSITHDKLIAGSVVGVTSAVCLVTSRREALDEQGHTIFYRLLNVGEVFGDVGYIAPSAQVASWAAGTSKLTVKANTFTSSADEVLSTDVAGFAVNDVLQLTDEYGTVRDGGFIATTILGHVITTSGMGVTPVDGDIVRVATYTSLVTSQKEDWAFTSQADGTLSSDTAKDYTS